MKTPRFSAIGAAFCVAVLLATPAQAAIQDIQSLITKARYAEAVTMADADLADEPKNPQIRFLKGIALAEMNRSEEAIGVFSQLTEDYPELPEPYNNLAVLYAQQRKFDKARNALEMAIRTHPSYATAHENLGDVYARLASQAYNQALQIDSANTAAQSKLALIRELMTVSTPSHGAAVVASAPVAQTVAAPAPTLSAPEATVTSDAPAPSPAQSQQATPASEPAAPPAPVATQIATAEPAAPANVSQTDAQQTVRGTVLAWAQAWANKDVSSYLAFYTPDFRPANGISHNAWKAQRVKRVGGKSGEIDVELDGLEINVKGDTASATFRQHYRSSGFSGSTDKTLELVERDGQWRIRQESIGRK